MVEAGTRTRSCEYGRDLAGTFYSGLIDFTARNSCYDGIVSLPVLHSNKI
jgi:hypothetical protein